MNRFERRRWPALAIMAAASTLMACGENPTDAGPPEVNPALIEATAGGAVSGSGGGVPQGSAAFTGPNGLLMDATAKEFIQQLTFNDGTVIKSSGVNVIAVPDESVANPPFYSMAFGAAVTGSHESVGAGTYVLMSEFPPTNFVDRVPVNYGSIYEVHGPDRDYASSGTFVIESIDYFNDVYACDLSSFEHSPLVPDLCEYQIGVLHGSIEMTVPTSKGDVVQQKTSFTLPIQREKLFVRYKSQ